MTDREKVIKGLECCIQSKYTGCPENCPMKDAKWTAEGNESCRAFDKSTIEMPLELIEDALAMLKAQEPKTCNECKHYDAKAFSDLGGKCGNSRSCHYCYGCDKSFGCNAWEGR